MRRQPRHIDPRQVAALTALTQCRALLRVILPTPTQFVQLFPFVRIRDKDATEDRWTIDCQEKSWRSPEAARGSAWPSHSVLRKKERTYRSATVRTKPAPTKLWRIFRRPGAKSPDFNTTSAALATDKNLSPIPPRNSARSTSL